MVIRGVWKDLNSFCVKDVHFKGKIARRAILEHIAQRIGLYDEISNFMKHIRRNDDPLNVDIRLDFGDLWPVLESRPIRSPINGVIDTPSPQEWRYRINIPQIKEALSIRNLDYDYNNNILILEASPS